MSEWMKVALEQAKVAAEEDEVPVGAVIVRQGKVLATGRNDREQTKSPIGHAEMRAIEKAAEALHSWRLEECELYVTLEPCPMCLSACQQARLSKVVYAAKDSKGGALCLGYHVHQDSKLNHQFEVAYEPMDECSQILKDFFSKKRK